MTNQQMELGFGGVKIAGLTRRERRMTRAQWWFAHMRHIVDRRSEEHTSELQSHHDLVCRLLLEKKQRMSFKNINDGFRRRKLVPVRESDEYLTGNRIVAGVTTSRRRYSTTTETLEQCRRQAGLR